MTVDDYSPVGVGHDGMVASGADTHRTRPRPAARLIELLRRQGLSAVLAAAIAVIVLPPVLRLAEQALSDRARGLRSLDTIPGIVGTYRTTALLAAGSTLLALILGLLLAWCTVRLPRRLQGVMSVAPLLPLVIPGVAAVIGWSFLLSPRVGLVNTALRRLPMFSGLETGPIDVFTVEWIVLLTGFSLTSFVYLFVYTSLRNMGGELESAAAASGASAGRIFFTITLPLLRPAIVYSTGICLLLGLGQFTAPLLLGRRQGVDVVTTEMFRLRESYPVNYGLGAALGMPLLAFGLLAVFMQRRAIGNERRYVTQGARSNHSSTLTSSWAALPLMLYTLVAVVLPLLALVYVAVSPYWSGSLSTDGLTLQHFRTVLFDNDRTRDAIETSVRTSLLAVAIALPLGFAAALALLRSSRVAPAIRGVLETIIMLPLAVPAALLGFGILFAYTEPPFKLYGSTAVIVITYVTLMLPFAMRSSLASLVAVGDDMAEASRVSGASGTRTALSVLFPLARRGATSGAAIMVVMLFHEFAASLMVRSPRTQVMGTVLYEFWSQGVYPQVAVMALVMVFTTAVGVAIALALGGRNALERL